MAIFVTGFFCLSGRLIYATLLAFAATGGFGEVVAGFGAILGMAAEEPAADAAVKAGCGMAGKTDDSPGERDGDVFP